MDGQRMAKRADQDRRLMAGEMCYADGSDWNDGEFGVLTGLMAIQMAERANNNTIEDRLLCSRILPYAEKDSERLLEGLDTMQIKQ